MSSGFAGAQRLDERRRRRLATQDADDPARPARSSSQPAADEASDSGFDPMGPIRDLSLGVLVPTSLWRHIVLCLTGFVVTAAILTASIHVDDLSQSAGRSLKSLLGPGVGSARSWWISASLLFQSQLALVVYWVRSHSLRDFDGRYHLWKHVSLASLAWSFCAATSIHTVAGELVAARLGWALPLSASWSWIGPAALVATLFIWGLHREMTACRGSDSTLFLSTLIGAGFAALSLGLVPLPAAWEPARLLILDGLTMAGIWMVCVSFLIHARYVIHLSAEPVPLRRWSFRIPRPHWLKFARRPKRTAPASPSEDESTEKAPRAKTPRRGKAEAPATETGTARDNTATDIAASAPVAVKKPVVRFDTSPVPAPSPANTAKADDVLVAELPTPFANRATPQPAVSRPSEPVRAPALEDRNPVEQNRFDRPEPAATTFDDDSDGGEEGGDDGPESDSDEFRGLSKKQRRKLLAQQRDRDRQNRRK